jgi:hypothetical protein
MAYVPWDSAISNLFSLRSATNQAGCFVTFLTYTSRKHLGTRMLSGALCKLVLPRSDSNGVTRLFSSAQHFHDSGEIFCAMIGSAAGQFS